MVAYVFFKLTFNIINYFFINLVRYLVYFKIYILSFNNEVFFVLTLRLKFIISYD